MHIILEVGLGWEPNQASIASENVLPFYLWYRFQY